MHFSVTFRHMESSPPLKDYAHDRLKKIKKYFPDPIQAHVVFSTERHRHIADVNITLHNGIALKSSEATEDMYSSLDLAIAKLERQVRKYKEKIRSHKPSTTPAHEMRHQVFVAESIEPPPTPPAKTPSPPGPQIIKDSKFSAAPMSIEEAVMQMNLLENDFHVFQDANTQHINVVYRRRDGNYGLIETGSRPSDS